MKTGPLCLSLALLASSARSSLVAAAQVSSESSQIAVVAAVLQPAKPASGPKILFELPVHDFGRLNGGESGHYVFTFTNGGDRTLEISAVKPECSCLVCEHWTHQVEPGMSGMIPVEFNTLNYSGPVSKKLSVISNDPGQPELLLDVKAWVWRAIDLAPPSAVFDLVPGELASGVSIHITNNEAAPLTLSEPKSSHKAIVAELNTVKEGREFNLQIKALPGSYSGNLFGQVTLKTSSTTIPLLEIRVFAMFREEITAAPSTVVLPRHPAGSPVQREIVIRARTARPVKISDPSLDVPGAAFDLREVRPGQLFSVNLTLPAGFDPGSRPKLELRVKTTHPQFPIIKVPITFAD
jgi:hypothetical protein